MSTDGQAAASGWDEDEPEEWPGWATAAPDPVSLDPITVAPTSTPPARPAATRPVPVRPPAAAPGQGRSATEPELPDEPANPARLALGVAMLAGDRLRVGVPNDTFVVGVGLAQQTVAELRGLARRALGPPSRAAGQALDWAAKRSGIVPNTGLLGRTRSRVGHVLHEARNVGRATIAAGRDDATAFVKASVAEGMAWAETQAVPRIVDSLVPHLVESVVPRIIDGVMPEIRNSVLPAVVDDLTNDPKVRELVTEQSRGVIGDAAHHVRSATASADDRVEMAFRRLIGGEKAEPPAGEPHAASPDR